MAGGCFLICVLGKRCFICFFFSQPKTKDKKQVQTQATSWPSTQKTHRWNLEKKQHQSFYESPKWWAFQCMQNNKRWHGLNLFSLTSLFCSQAWGKKYNLRETLKAMGLVESLFFVFAWRVNHFWWFWWILIDETYEISRFSLVKCNGPTSSNHQTNGEQPAW